MRKRLIALLLSLMMTLVLLPASFAEEDPAAENPEPAESLEPAEGLRAAGDVTIDSTNFPDDNFRNYVQNDLRHVDPSYFTPAEIADITVIKCDCRNIENLQGIELFTSLEALNCQDNQLMDIDVSAMPSLKKLDCHSNPLSGTIRIHENLEELECWNSQIDGTRILFPMNSRLRVVKVDASGFSDLSFLYGRDLETLDCAYIDFESLDFTPWNNLHDLRCDNCNLSRLNVSGLSNLTRIRANDNNLTALDVSAVPALEELYVYNNHIAALDLSACPNLWGAELNQTADGFMTEDSGHYLFDLTSIGVADASRVTISDTDWTLDSVTGVATYNGSGIPNQLVYTYDTGNAGFPMQVTVTLGVAVTVDPNDFDPGFFNWLLNKGIVNDSGNGVYTISSAVTELDCGYEGLTSLKGIGYFQNLERLNCQDNNLTNALSAELSQNTALKTLICHSNYDITALDFSANTNLEELEVLNCSGLTSLNIAGNTHLRMLVVDATPLTLKDSNGDWIYATNTALEKIACKYLNITELDVSMLPALREVEFGGCGDLETLTLGVHPNLEAVLGNGEWNGCRLHRLDLSAYSNLKRVNLGENRLAELILPDKNADEYDEIYLEPQRKIVGNYHATAEADGTYTFDLGLLGVTEFACVTPTNASWKDQQAGIVGFASKPSELTYTYQPANSAGNYPSFNVTVYLGDALAINQTNFPDENLRNALREHPAAIEDGALINAEDVTELDLWARDITDMTGIALFPNLEVLQCSSNHLSTLDLTGNPKLRELRCEGCSLTELLVSATDNPELEIIEANENLLTSLNVAGMTALAELNVERNQLETLPLNGCSSLWRLNCSDNRLKVLDLSDSNVTDLSPWWNPLSVIVFKDGFNAQGKDIYAEPLSGYSVESSGSDYTFDLSTLIPLEYMGQITMEDPGSADLDSATGMVTFRNGKPDELCYYVNTGTDENGDPYPTFRQTILFGTDIELNSTNFPDPAFLDFLINRSGSATQKNGKYYISDSLRKINCNNSGIESLEGIALFPNLEQLYANRNSLTQLDLSGNLHIQNVEAEFNQIAGIDVSMLSELMSLWLGTNQIPSIDLSYNENLWGLCISNNPIDRLDLSKNEALTNLVCANIHTLTKLDLSHNPRLESLDPNDTMIERLDLSANEELEYVQLYQMPALTELKLPQEGKFMLFAMEGTPIQSLDLSAYGDTLRMVHVKRNRLGELLLPTLPAGEDYWELDFDEQNAIEGLGLTRTQDGKYAFDLTQVVAKENLSRVSGLTFDADGIVTLDEIPYELTYQFDVGYNSETLEVHLVGFEVVPAFKTKSLVLSGLIGVNFYMDLSCLSDEEKADSYMEFTVNGRTERADFDPDFTSRNRSVCYGFTCHIASIEMADEITAEFHYGDDKTIGTTYSAQKYIDKALEDESYPADARNLVEATADYGHYVQAYLKEVKNWPDDEHVTIKARSEIGEAEIAAAAAGTADYTVTANVPEGAFVRSLSYSLMMDDMVTLILSVRTESGHALSSAKIGEETLPIEGGAGGRYRVRIENIMAHQLGNRYTIVLNAGGEDAEITVSPMSYVKTLLTASAYENNLTAKQAAAAIYQYYQAAIAYIDARKAH